jgi:hypothetical protein
MSITTPRTSSDGRQASNGARPATARPRPAGRRRQVPLVVVGVLLVVGCALAFTDASLHLGSREEVLVVSQPLAGQVLTPGDLRAAKVSTGTGVSVVPVAEESTVVGRNVAVPLVAGALLTADEVGSASPVGSGSDVVALALKAGSFPPDLSPGDRVQVVPVSSPSGGADTSSSAGSPLAATVLAVEPAPADSDSGTVFSLQVPRSDADEVASLAAAGEASLVQVGASG